VRLRLFAVGRRAADLADVETRFTSRIASYARMDVIELPEGRGRQAVQRRQQEARHILQRAGAGFTLFDERGRMLDSRQWAAFLETRPADACLDFVIGGADGVSDDVRRAAARQWSLSPLTLPHQLVRVLVLEQIYRAFTIRQGHPYHRA